MARIKKGVKQSRLNLKVAREKKKKQTPSVDARVTTSSESPLPPPPSMSPSQHPAIWRYCSKHKNATKEMLDFATAQAVSNFNGGYLSSDLCSKLGVAFTDKNYKYLTKENTKMDRPIKKKIRSKQLQKDLEAYASELQSLFSQNIDTMMKLRLIIYHMITHFE
ncbi:hypothetical protein O3P69_014950 [Scylla paramamosain]|uniref:Uncharacterized protein n=1 Tax=Scylla paramamosain TaxID=85552 RepID=A0AAW0SEJ5_SCYPA